MNPLHKNRQQAGIDFALREKQHRIKKSFTASEKQLNVVERVIAARRLIDTIPNDAKVLIYGAGWQASYLFRYTTLWEKNIISVVDTVEVTWFYDKWHGGKAYRVVTPSDDVFQQADVTLIAEFERRFEMEEKILNCDFQGRIIRLYDEDARMPLFCVETAQQQEKILIGCQPLQIHSYTVASDFYLGMLDRIDKVNDKLSSCHGKRVMIYGAGGHTYFLMRYTNIREYRLVAIADKGARNFFGIRVRSNEASSFADADCIVVSSYRFQDDMKNYLESIGQGDKLVLLYDENDPCEFYENYNENAPDLPYHKDEVPKYESRELYGQLEPLLKDLTHNSDYYVTYRLWEDPLEAPECFYDEEDDVLVIKNYQEANRQMAIILQGPVVYEDQFTYRTIQMYLRYFPGAKIILSTWHEEAEDPRMEAFRGLPIELVFSPMPQNRGSLNINCQLRSSHAGIRRAEELDIPYCIKTRTDFRIHAKECLSLAYTMLQQYPLPVRINDKGIQRERLVVLPPHLDSGYYIPDYIMIGNTQDMLVFWQEGPLEKYQDVMNPEMLIYSRFFEQLGMRVEDPVDNIPDYVKGLAERLIVLDAESFGAVWRKYSYESFEMIEVSGKNRFNHTDWLKMQKPLGRSGLVYIKPGEGRSL